MRDVFICDAIRTPIGRFGGGLSTVRADDLAALPLKALIERNPSVDWAAVDEVFFGCANQAGEDNRNVARMRCCWLACPTVSLASPSTACVPLAWTQSGLPSALSPAAKWSWRLPVASSRCPVHRL